MKHLTLVVVAIMALATVAFAQEPVAILEYFDNVDGVIVTSGEGEDLYPEYGMELYPGDKITTRRAVVELRLDPNGSLLKLANNTQFVIDTLQNRAGAEANTFSLITGKIKAVAARSGNEQYQILTQTAVCGVRGTTFGLESVEGSRDAAIVERGLITFQNIATGAILQLQSGEFADTFAEVFQAITVTAEQLADFFAGINEFVGENMNAAAVPGNEPVPSEEAETPPPTEATPTVETPADTPTAEQPAAGDQPGILDPIFEVLRDVLGMEIGSITIDGRTYSKAVLQPTFAFGKLKLGLYLPIIYQTNVFDPEDWYRPRGNDEWSFGSEYWDTDPLAGALDLLSDLFLKIRYIEWGKQRDKFYFKVGNLNNMTIGHGVIMRNYANDADFPAVRRVGINAGVDLGGFGLEGVVNDLAEPEIFGGRFFFRPLGNTFRMAIGLTAIADIDPAGSIPVADPDDPDATDRAGDPIFIGVGADIDFPIIETDFLSIVLFADVAGMMPYYRGVISNDALTIGPNQLYFAALYDAAAMERQDMPLRNYGISAGVFGNVFIMDYRLEYRRYRGTFRPTFFNSNYDRLRGEYVYQLRDELLNPQDVPPVDGIYGEAGFTIGEKFRIEAGYMWPWTPEGMGDDDFLHLEAIVGRGLIPKIDIHGSISYDRTKFIPTLLRGEEEKLTLFDANTIVRGEIIYPVAPMLDIAFMVTTTMARDEAGNVIADANGRPKVSPSISIETRVHF